MSRKLPDPICATGAVKFGVSADELREAINAVGDRAGVLRQYLDQRKK